MHAALWLVILHMLMSQQLVQVRIDAPLTGMGATAHQGIMGGRHHHGHGVRKP